MVKKAKDIFLKHKIWLIALMVVTMVFGMFLWLVDVEGFLAIFSTMILGCLILYCVLGFYIYKSEQKREKAIKDFLDTPQLSQEEAALKFAVGNEKGILSAIGRQLREKGEIIKQQDLKLLEYQEYIETWAHEIKTPLALMTFILDNRRDEMSLVVYKRLEYARTRIQEDLDKMLLFARLKSAHTDYLFTYLSLRDICDEVLEEYQNILQEENITVLNETKDLQVVSDKKALAFIIQQLVSNAIKYKKQGDFNSYIRIKAEVEKETGNIVMLLQDNGVGVKPYDLPFIFDKGFTGDNGQQGKKSTGMGLYLSKQVAEQLNIQLEISKEYQEGCEIKVFFPKVE